MPIPRDSLADRVKQDLMRRIVSGELEPGERLVELQLAKDLNTSQGPVREAFLAALAARLPVAPFAKIPASVTVDRLLGGLALAETLRSGTPVFEPGLLGALDGGVALLAMAERLPSAAVAPPIVA